MTSRQAECWLDEQIIRFAELFGGHQCRSGNSDAISVTCVTVTLPVRIVRARPRGPVPHDRVRPGHDPLSQTEANAMQNLTKMTAAAFAAFTLTACVEEGATRSEPAGMRQASSAAESACMTHLNSQYGGNVARIDVLSSEFSQANSVVMLAAVGN
jgi:hypothetical protein